MRNSDLPAILGGSPLFDQPCHLVKPAFPPISELIKGLEELNVSRYLSNQGKFVSTLEKKIEAMLNVKHCALFCNGTIAIMSLIRSLSLQGEIIVPSFTYAATTQAFLWSNIKPKFIDIDWKTLTIDPKKIEKNVSQDTSAIFPVNIFGGSCDHDQIQAIAQKYKLPLIYDSAQAFGTQYKGKMVGSFGNAEVFSFHATKIFHTGEGGAVVTNNTDLYEKLCRIRNFGFDNYLNCAELGLNGKMNEFSGLIGLKLFDNVPSQIKNYKKVFLQYEKNLKNIPGIITPGKNLNCVPNYSYFYIKIDPDKFGLTSLELNYALMADFIVSRCYFYPPVHRTTYYQKLLSPNSPYLPETDRASLCVLCLPLYSDMRIEVMSKIVEGIARCHLHAQKIKKYLVNKIPCQWESLKSQSAFDPYNKYILRNEIN